MGASIGSQRYLVRTRRLIYKALFPVFVILLGCLMPIHTMAAGTDSLSGPIWSQGHYFPRFPAVSNLLVLDLSYRLNDRLVLTLLSLQGIVNRDSPQIYLILDQYGSFWLQYAKTTMPSLQTTQLSSETDLIPDSLLRSKDLWFTTHQFLIRLTSRPRSLDFRTDLLLILRHFL